MSFFHLHRFEARLAVAVVILGMVILAHAGFVHVVELAGIATLTLWVVMEARHAYASRKRQHPPHTPKPCD